MHEFAVSFVVQDKKGTWEQTIIRGNQGFRFSLPGADRLWELELQPTLGTAQGVAVQSQPDFVLRCDDDRIKPVAIFTDGFQFHCHLIDQIVTTTVGDHSVFKGPEPMVEKCKDEKAEAEAIVAWVQMLMSDHGLATHEICVTPYKPMIRTELTSANIAMYELKPREEDPGSDEAGVRMSTMKRIKGLEFRAVAMACADPRDPMISRIDSLSSKVILSL